MRRSKKQSAKRAGLLVNVNLLSQKSYCVSAKAPLLSHRCEAKKGLTIKVSVVGMRIKFKSKVPETLLNIFYLP